MRLLSITVLVIVGLVIGTFAVQNHEFVQLDFLSWRMALPLSLSIVLTYLLGMITGGWLIAMIRRSLHYARRNSHA